METRTEMTSWDSARRIIDKGLLSILMPSHRLGPSIADNVRQVHAIFREQLPFEIIVIDDGSGDNTRTELERVAASFPEVNPVYLPQNVGKGAALRSGFEHSHGNYVLLLDADLDLPPSQVSGFFDIMEEQRVDVVIGSKRHQESTLDYPWHRALMSNMYYYFIKLMLGLPVRDTQTGLKLFKRDALEYALAKMLVKRFAFDLELLAIINEKGYSIAEAPVTLRFSGNWGCIRPSVIYRTLWDTLAIIYRVRILHYYQSK